MSSQSGLPLPVTLSDLESHLWEAANILRGSPVDRTDWKSYILPLLFFKRICDVWDEEHAAMLAQYGTDYADEHRFQVPEGCHWSDVRRVPRNVGTALANAMRGSSPPTKSTYTASSAMRSGPTKIAYPTSF